MVRKIENIYIKTEVYYNLFIYNVSGFRGSDYGRITFRVRYDRYNRT